jgi:hypothetical protein
MTGAPAIVYGAYFAGLAMAEVDAFFIAHALLLGWVLAELTEGALRIVLYRRGG